MGNLAATLVESEPPPECHSPVGRARRVRNNKTTRNHKAQEVLEAQPQHFRAIGIVERVVKIHLDSNNIRIIAKHVHDDFPPCTTASAPHGTATPT
mgnify:CR=1 FL=1